MQPIYLVEYRDATNDQNTHPVHAASTPLLAEKWITENGDNVPVKDSALSYFSVLTLNLDDPKIASNSPSEYQFYRTNGQSLRDVTDLIASPGTKPVYLPDVIACLSKNALITLLEPNNRLILSGSVSAFSHHNTNERYNRAVTRIHTENGNLTLTLGDFPENPKERQNMNPIHLFDLISHISWSTSVLIQEEDGTVLYDGNVQEIADPNGPFNQTTREVEGLHTSNDQLVITLTSDE